MKNLIGLLLLVLMLIGCSNNNLEIMTLVEFYEKDFQDVSKIVIVDGSTGFNKTIDEIAFIERFLDQIKEIKFIPEANQEGRVGWRYSVTLFEDGEYTFQFGLTQVNGHYYYTEPDIYPIVDTFYKIADAQGK